MAKRKLTKQQHRRIARKQRGLGAGAGPTGDSGGERQEGRVIARYGKQADVSPLPETASNPVVRCHIRANVEDVVAGDRVLYLSGEQKAVIEAVLPRRTLMVRPDTRGRPRPVAANVDQIGIVLAPVPEPHANLLDRYLVAAETLNLSPLLILNKMDLLREEDGALPALLDAYGRLGYPVVKVSAARGEGIAELADMLLEKTTVSAGQSGVGKSSLINLICPAAGAAVGDLSRQTKGRHTTTSATFYHLPGGGNLIDSPGIRSFGLWHLDPAQVAQGFVEFRPWLGRCRFRDCRHFHEPGCAIREALEAGAITPQRLQSYRQIVSDPALR